MPLRRWRTVLALALVAVASPVSLTAQQDAPPHQGGVPVLSPIWRALSDSSRAGWVRPIASLLIPGMGQFLGNHDRGAIYLVAEALFVTRYLAFGAEGRRERTQYRDLAFVVARGAYAPTTRDTVFEYYEQMGRYIESGPYDGSSGALVPPTDPRSYNGAIWELARRTYFTNPDSTPDVTSEEYQRAIAFYTRRAIGPNFQWSWRNAGLEQDLYRQTIHQSDEAFRRATQQLGLVLANHLVSAVDAFISGRLATRGVPVHLESGFLPSASGGGDLRWTVMVHLGF